MALQFAASPAEPDHTPDHETGKPADGDTPRPESGSFAEDEPIPDAVLLRRLDLFILPPLMLLYLLSFLDRINIGNARLYGLEADLGLSPDQFSTAVSVLYATYLASELPSNLLLQRLRPSRWIAFIATGWGVVATCMGAVQTYGGLLACRLLLGLFEGGLFPGLAVYLTLFYTRRELALRIGYLFVSAALAGAFGGLLAFAIGSLDGRHGLAGWRWIFIIEGLPAAVLGVLTWWLLADAPASAYYLDRRQRRAVDRRILAQPGHSSSGAAFHWADVRDALADWTTYAFAVALFCSDTMLYGYATFLPSIIGAINPGWSRSAVQLLTIPCYALGAATYLAVAYVSDRCQRRAVFVIPAGLVSLTGYGMLLSARSRVQYAGTFLVAAGLYTHVGLPLAWLPSNCPRFGKRTTATGMQLMVGNCAGILSSFLYKRPDTYWKGHVVTLSLLGTSCLIYTGLALYYYRANRQRQAERLLLGELVDEEAKLAEKEKGSRSVWFDYTY